MAFPQPATVYDEAVPADQEFINIGERLIKELSELKLPDEDGIPLESNWHRMQIDLLTETVEQHWKDRNDFFVGGNMFIYFSMDQVKNKDYRGPDFFCVKDTDGNRKRKTWTLWEENGRYPNVIIELASESTIKTDLQFKKKLYERTFRTPEYFCYDPEKQKIYGWRLKDGHYEEILPDENGRLECREIGLWLGLWQGEHLRVNETWLRFYTENGQLVPKFAEAEAQRAEAEAQRAEAEAQRAEAEAQRAEKETQRANAAEEEIKRLHALLAEKGIKLS